MNKEKTEMEKHKVLRLSNEESNKLTRECLKTAMLRLLAKKDIEKITITELVKVAGVSRTAFYSNYSSKEDILVSNAEEFSRRIIDLAWNGIVNNEMYELYMKLFEEFRSEYDKIDVAMKAGLEDYLFDAIEQEVIKRFGNLDKSTDYLLAGMGGMMNSVMLRWYRNGMNDSPADMAALCNRLTKPCIYMIMENHPDFPEII